MGYYTAFILEDAKSNSHKAMDKVRSFETIEAALKADFNYDLDLTGNETYKWYSWKEACLAVSAANPTIAFKISGIGENAGDVWWADFYNGQMTDYWKKPAEKLKLSCKTLRVMDPMYGQP